MAKNSLFHKFVIPPFSILDTRAGYWQVRKRKWKKFGNFCEDETRDSLVYNPSASQADGFKKIMRVGSLLEFDPVLAEILYKWFVPKIGDKICDPFSGGPVRGIVASQLGFSYLGIDLRQEQVDLNHKKALSLNLTPSYIVGDSNIVLDNLKEEFDFILSCPPYYNLEKYTDNPKDLSNIPTYEEFLVIYESIIKKSLKLLKENRFACFVVGDLRDKEGFYRNFVSDTIGCFLRNGVHLYNEIIYLGSVGSASLRVNIPFSNYRKVAKIHQNVLVFYKGEDCSNVKNEFPLNLEDHFGDHNQKKLV